MAKTLVVKDADWSSNALFTTTFIGDNSCTGITLNQSTASLQNVGTTLTLTATPTPLDTTDTITWESSDETVATVSSGVVTVVGIGTTTITVSCGDYSDTCVVTTRCFMVPNVALVSGVYISGVGVADGNQYGYPTFAESSLRGTWAGESGRLPLYGNASNYYPYVLPLNTKKVKISADTSAYTIYRFAYINSQAATPQNTATLIRNLDSSAVPAVTGGYLVEIPTIEGYTIDSIAVSLRNQSGDWTSSDFGNVEIEFLAN